MQAQILNRVKRDLIHQPLQLLTGVNVIGMTSSTLGTMSRGAASLSKDDDFVRVRTNQVRILIHVNFSIQHFNLFVSDRSVILHGFSKLCYRLVSKCVFLLNTHAA